ncbi:MAG TPA: DUF4265 domain-containing protein [Epsilonproteobacteria bacterium]|nr:DUF4265 domain-containing protein [Campylobacterota bacterium]
MEKIHVPLNEDWHNFSVETLWGEKINKDVYKIASIPFFAKGISFDDLIKVKLDQDKKLFYDKHISKGDYCTYRFLFDDNDPDATSRRKYLDLLSSYGDMEYYDESDLYALSVPKKKVHELYKILNQLEKDEILDFEEGDCIL